jgi:hypothetical protein
MAELVQGFDQRLERLWAFVDAWDDEDCGSHAGSKSVNASVDECVCFDVPMMLRIYTALYIYRVTEATSKTAMASDLLGLTFAW